MTWHGTATVLGKPASQGSKRHVGRGIMIDADPNLKSWRKQMQDEMRECAPPTLVDAPVWITLKVYVKRPAGHFGTGRNAGKLKPNAPKIPKSGTDMDKILRACFDAATGVWLCDDQRVAGGTFHRIYSDRESVLFKAAVMEEDTKE